MSNDLMYYVIRVFQDGSSEFEDYKVHAPSEDIARLVAMAIDGGLGLEVEDWAGSVLLAKQHTHMVSKLWY